MPVFTAARGKDITEMEGQRTRLVLRRFLLVLCEGLEKNTAHCTAQRGLLMRLSFSQSFTRLSPDLADNVNFVIGPIQLLTEAREAES